METFNLQNIIDGQAISISITGMAIVFCGLVLITGYIMLLPHILDLLTGQKKAPKKAKPEPKVEKVSQKVDAPIPAEAEITENESNDIASVIGLVLQLEQERFANIENEQITLSRNSQQPSMWGKAGKMRKMPQRRTHA